MQKHLPLDARGRHLRAGDWIRVLQAPLSVIGMPAESLDAFSSAIGHTFQVLAFDPMGCIELELHPKLARMDTIWLEPFCCVRSRRPSKPGKRFREHQAWLAGHTR